MNMPKTAGGSDPPGKGLLYVILGIGGASLFFSSLSNNEPVPEANTSFEAMPSAVEPVAELVPSAVVPEPHAEAARKAVSHLRLALDAEGFPGAMLYSQNCFASLERQFSWEKLDQCGSFDALARLGATEAVDIPLAETAYFEEVTTSQRFMRGALAAQADEQSVRSHFADLQTVALGFLTDLQTVEQPLKSEPAEDLEEAMPPASLNEISEPAPDQLNSSEGDDISPSDAETPMEDEQVSG
jgi:hypothetical protein